MKLIKLTGRNGTILYINPAQIGHIFRVTVKYAMGDEFYTTVGVTTHNNGGFEVKETPEQIVHLLFNPPTE